MATWGEFRRSSPALAARAQELLYQFGVGLGFLGTVDPDGGPRVHPLCPIVSGDELYLLVVPGPKRADLRRDGRYALHSFPCVDDENAAYLTGRATEVNDAQIRSGVERRFIEERSAFPIDPASLTEHGLFRLDVERCLITTTTGHGDPTPHHQVWREQAQE